MKENVGTREENFNFTDVLIAAAQQLLVGVFGFFSSRASVMGLFAPFGIAFSAGMPKKYIAVAGIGAALGYFIYSVSGNCLRSGFGNLIFLDFFKALVITPFFSVSATASQSSWAIPAFSAVADALLATELFTASFRVSPACAPRCCAPATAFSMAAT